MIEILLPLFGLALVDSINPSAIAVTLYLLVASKNFVPRVLIYVTAIFCVYLTFGTAMMLGVDAVLGWAGDVLESPVAYGVQGVIGAAMLTYAIAAPSPREKEVSKARVPKSSGLMSVALLGVTITIVEFITALPYFGAIGLLTRAELPISEWFPILLVYNVIFVLPPLLLLLIYRTLGARLQEQFDDLIPRLNKGARITMLWIIGIVGFYLLADSLSYFEFFGLMSSSK